MFNLSAKNLELHEVENFYELFNYDISRMKEQILEKNIINSNDPMILWYKSRIDYLTNLKNKFLLEKI